VLYPQCERGSHGCGRGNADCDFQPCRRQKRTESGLSERQFELKSFTIIIARNRTGSRRKIADWERTERARRDSANCFEMWWPGTELNRRRQPFQVALISIHNNLTGLRWLRKCFKSRGRQSHLGPGSWAGRTDFVHAAVEPGIVLRSQLARPATLWCSTVRCPDGR